jgi:hypothetical protein
MVLATKMTVATSLAVPKQASLYFQPIDRGEQNLAPATFRYWPTGAEATQTACGNAPPVPLAA